jgi:hypothetical protein
MAIIYTYPIKTAADAGDLVLISDSKDGNKTKNTSISSIKDVIDVVDSISPGPGISVSSPTGNVTVGNTGVLSLTAGSNISLSGSTGNITISTSASNVDGSGTTNRIPRWTDSNTLGDSQISQNGSAIGIGAALGTAVGSLEVFNGALNNQLFITCPDTSQAAINFGGTSAKTKGRINYSDNADVMMFHTNSSEKMRITQSGKVGIGITGPDSILTVRAASADVGIPVIKTSVFAYANGITLIGDNYVSGKSQINLGISYSGANAVLSRSVKVSNTTDDVFLSSQDIYSTNPNAFVLDRDGSFRFLNTSTNANTPVGTAVSLSERMRITNTGAVGIGTTNPTATLDVVGSGVGNNAIKSFGEIDMVSYNSLARVSVGDGKATLRCPGGTTSIGDPSGDVNGTSINVDDNATEIQVNPGNKMLVNGLVDLQNLNVSGAQGNNGDVLTSSGTGVSWAPGGGSSYDTLTAGCASVGSSSSTASNPRQAAFTFPNEVGSSNFGPCLVAPNDFDVENVAIKWNGSNAPTIGANGTVNFKLGKLTDPAGNPDTQEGTVNYTNIFDLTALQITSADSGTWIYKTASVAGSGVSVTKGDVIVLLFPRPTTGWTGTGATNGDLQLSMFIKYG